MSLLFTDTPYLNHKTILPLWRNVNFLYKKYVYWVLFGAKDGVLLYNFSFWRLRQKDEQSKAKDK